MKRSLLLLISLIATSVFAVNKDASKSTVTGSITNIIQKALSMSATGIESVHSNCSSTTAKVNRDRGYMETSITKDLRTFLSIKENTDSVQKFMDTQRLTRKEKMAVRNKIKAIKMPNNIRSRFNSLFSSWEHFINTNSKIIYSSNLEDRKQSEYYSQLLQMGKDILPLVVEKMLNEKYFYAIILYDELQNNDPQLCYKAGDRTTVGVIVGEQTRAARTVLKWYHNVSKSK